MNLRLSSNSARIRITGEELQALLLGNGLSETIHFTEKQTFRYGIHVKAGTSQDPRESEITYIKAPDSLIFNVSREALLKLQFMPKTKDLGIYVDSTAGAAQSLSLSLEVDIRSLKSRDSRDSTRPSNHESHFLSE